LEDLEANRLAFFRMELSAENLTLANNGWDAAIAWYRCLQGFIDSG
jgi:hypothetical protein